MQYIVLYQHSCAACSQVARMVNDLEIAGLEARPLADPQVMELLGRAGRQLPDRPSMLIVDNDNVQLISGWAMRRRLAHVVGWRRSGAIIRLLAAEWRARMARSAGSHVPSRRKVLGGAAATAVAAGLAWRLKPSGSSASRLGTSESRPEVTVATPAEAEELLATSSVQRSIRAWGPVGDIFKVSGAQPTFMLSHPRDAVITVVDNSPGAIKARNPVAIAMGKSPDTADAIRYYTVDGSSLVDVKVSGGVTTTAFVRSETPDRTPDSISDARYRLFVACVGTMTTPQCAQGCINCLPHPNAMCIGACITCAGPAALKCARFIWG